MPCNTSYFSCEGNTSQCFSWRFVCDNDEECSDGSDESKSLCENTGKCGGTFTSPSGTLTSPDKRVDRNTDCIYQISQPIGTYLNLMVRLYDQAQIPGIPGLQGSVDKGIHLEIRDGNSSQSQLIGKFSGDRMPESIRTSGNHLRMK